MTFQIEIPGGTADLYTEDEITPRRLKPVVKLSIRNSAVTEKVQAAQKLKDSGVEAATPDFTDDEADRFADMQVITAWAYLAGWSLDREIPDTPDGMFDVPQAIVNAISEAIKKVKEDAAKDLEPSPENVANPESPTSA